MWWAALLACFNPDRTGVLDEAPCSAELTASGAVDVSWDASTALECEGYGPWMDDSIDLYLTEGFDTFRVRLDFVTAGEMGTFDDAFVSFTHEDEEWGAFDDVTCSATLTRNEDIGDGELGYRVWALEGTASCDDALAPFQSEGTVDIGEVQFEAWYQQAE